MTPTATSHTSGAPTTCSSRRTTASPRSSSRASSSSIPPWRRLPSCRHRIAIRLAVPKAFIALGAGHAPSGDVARSIFEHSRGNLAGYKRVRRLEFSELPKTVSGKIRRVDLRGRENALREQGANAARRERVLGRGLSRTALTRSGDPAECHRRRAHSMGSAMVRQSRKWLLDSARAALVDGRSRGICLGAVGHVRLGDGGLVAERAPDRR